MSDHLHPNIFPAVRYADADAGVAFLKHAFGATEKAVHRGEDGVIHHAELALGDGLVMVGQHSQRGVAGRRSAAAAVLDGQHLRHRG